MQRVVEVGGKYGHLTVVDEAAKGKYGYSYRCRCDCGNETVVQKSFLFKSDHIRCVKCSPAAVGLKNKRDIVGKTLNGWRIMREVSHLDGEYVYECECQNCGNLSHRSTGAIMMSRSARCIKCTPNYHFVFENDKAIGTLRDGTQFVVDKDMIAAVSRWSWAINRDGYLSRRNHGKSQVLLHRFVMAERIRPKDIVDHINRDRLDYRRANLRVATPTQNSANHRLYCTNKTGYTGVYFATGAQRYEVTIGYRGRRIRLGISKGDTVLLAQMYNIAALFFFGEFAGELNDVPPSDERLRRQVQEKCLRYLVPTERSRALSFEGAFAME